MGSRWPPCRCRTADRGGGRNRTHRTGITRPTRFEDEGGHQTPFTSDAGSTSFLVALAASRGYPGSRALGCSCELLGLGLVAAASNSQEVAGAGVGAGVAQFAHRTGLDLADALTGEVEVLADFLERAGLAAVEPEPQREDLPLPLVERCQQLLDLVGEQRGGCDLERRLRRAVLDDVAEFGVAVFAQRLRQREWLRGETQGLGDLVLGHLDLDRELGEGRGTAELQ